MLFPQVVADGLVGQQSCSGGRRRSGGLEGWRAGALLSGEGSVAGTAGRSTSGTSKFVMAPGAHVRGDCHIMEEGGGMSTATTRSEPSPRLSMEHLTTRKREGRPTSTTDSKTWNAFRLVCRFDAASTLVREFGDWVMVVRERQCVPGELELYTREPNEDARQRCPTTNNTPNPVPCAIGGNKCSSVLYYVDRCVDRYLSSKAIYPSTDSGQPGAA